MEEHKIDSIIKKIMTESEGYYDTEALEAKDKIWKSIRLGRIKISNSPLVKVLSAACIILLILTASLSYSLISTKKEMKIPVTITSNLNNKLIHENNPVKPTEINTANQPVKVIHDTLVVEKKEVIYKTVEIQKQVVDTVYLEQLVYIEKEPDKALKEIAETTDNYQLINKPYEKESDKDNFSFKDEYILTTYNSENRNASLKQSKLKNPNRRRIFTVNYKQDDYEPVVFGNL